MVLLIILLSIRANYQTKSTILRCRILKFSKWLRTGLSPSATVTEFKTVTTQPIHIFRIASIFPIFLRIVYPPVIK